MKKTIITSIIGLAVAGALTSCEDFLTVDPQDKLVIENYYTSAEMIRSNTRALYSYHEWLYFVHDFQWKFDELAGDMFYTNSEEGQFYFGSFNNNNQYLNQGWKGLYNVIGVANTIINDMPGPAANNGVAEADIIQGIAEARCVRGICYYLLSQYWGDVPIIENGSDMVSSGNIQVPRNKRFDVYKFAERDLKYAAEHLGAVDSDASRCTKWTALGFLAKLHLTMASHPEMADRDALYANAASEARQVINGKGVDLTTIDYSTLFDKEANNGPESLFQIQCMVGGYGYGNGRNCAWARVSLADQAWGNGKGPTISLQEQYSDNDKRTQWVYMTDGFHYPNIEKAKGGYTYEFWNKDRGDETNEMLAHLKKYILGHSADVEGGIGGSQDAPNNIYLLRLADMYFTLAEAIIGTGTSTSDREAINAVNTVRSRAGLAGIAAPLTFEQVIKERRCEFAMESQNWFDILRWYYRDANAALAYLNGMQRQRMWVRNDGVTENHSEMNKRSNYHLASNRSEGASYDPADITLTMQSFIMPLPQVVLTASPQLADDPVDFEFSEE